MSSGSLLDNHHVNAHKPNDVTSSAAHKGNLSYSYDEYNESIHAVTRKERRFKSSKKETAPAECTVPQCDFVPEYMLDSDDDLNPDVNMKKNDNTHSFISCNKTRLAFVYDDDTASLTSVDSTTVHLLQVQDTSDNSAGNTFSIASDRWATTQNGQNYFFPNNHQTFRTCRYKSN
jgi:hypothetical protein